MDHKLRRRISAEDGKFSLRADAQNYETKVCNKHQPMSNHTRKIPRFKMSLDNSESSVNSSIQSISNYIQGLTDFETNDSISILLLYEDLDLETELSQIEKNIKYALRSLNCHVKIQNCDKLQDNKIILAVSIIDSITNKRCPSELAIQHLQQGAAQRLNEAITNKLIRIIPLSDSEKTDSDQNQSDEDSAESIDTSSEFSDPVDDDSNSQISDEPAFDSPQPSLSPPARFSISKAFSLGLLLIPMLTVVSLILTKSINYNNVPSFKLEINFESIDELTKTYPNFMTLKKVRIIKNRLTMMESEISILLLLGRARDKYCHTDPTYCISQMIANATSLEFKNIDASKSDISHQRIVQDLESSSNRAYRSLLIDSLESLPGDMVMNLFKYIDKDETNMTKGLLIFVVYSGQGQFAYPEETKEADVEELLTKKWSPFIPKDTLSSVISRLSASIVKVY